MAKNPHKNCRSNAPISRRGSEKIWQCKYFSIFLLNDLIFKEGDADVKHVIHNLSRLRYLIVTDKPLEPLVSDLPNTDVWNKDLKSFQDQVCLKY